jgi:hypothetical protein
MAKERSPKKRRRAPKTVLRLPDLDQAKSAVLNTLSSRDAQRGYRHAMDEFIEWYCSEPRLSFSRTVVVSDVIVLDQNSAHPVRINLVALNGNGIKTTNENDLSLVAVVSRLFTGSRESFLARQVGLEPTSLGLTGSGRFC